MPKKFQISKDSQCLGICKFLSFQGLSFGLSQKLIRKKLIKVNQKNISAHFKLSIGDEVSILANVSLNPKDQKKSKKIDPKKIDQIKKSIIFKDNNLIAINKNSGLAVQGGSKINFCIDDSLPYLRFGNEENPKLVHRLDKDTSGILLIARNRKSADILAQAFKNKTIQKTYLAVVKGSPKQKKGVINIPIIKKYQGKNEKVYKDELQGKEAITNYKLLKSYLNNTSLLELKPITGRTHQIRVHLKEIGHPIIGDVKYGTKSVLIPNMSNRLHLHALKIELDNFFGKKLLIETNIPDFTSSSMFV